MTEDKPTSGNSYFIRGTINLVYNETAIKINLVPSAGFLTPFKPERAIAFPKSVFQTKRVGSAKLIPLSVDKPRSGFIIDVAKNDYLGVLAHIAASQKIVELQIQSIESGWELTGFEFPPTKP